MSSIIQKIVIHRIVSDDQDSVQGIKPVPQFHCIIDRHGHAKRLTGMCSVLRNDTTQNKAYHIAFIDKKNTGTCGANPTQFLVLYEKIKELQSIFPNAELVSADVYDNDPQKNIGLQVQAWFEFYGDNREIFDAVSDPENQDDTFNSCN